MRLDEAVSVEVLEAIRPLGVEAALQAADLARRADSEKQKALELAFEKARYEADRARRQFDAVEPENRLVVAELELRWNAALQQVADLESRVRSTIGSQPALTEGERDRLLQLGNDLAALWNDPCASTALKKRILRVVLKEVVLDVREGDSPKVHLRLHWAGGTHTELLVPKNRSGRRRSCTDRSVVELVGELAKVSCDRDIASILNRLGYRTGPGNTWKKSRVASLRNHHKIPPCERGPQKTWRTMAEAADELGVSPPVIRRLIGERTLPATQVVRYAPWVIERKDLDLPATQAAIQAVRQGTRCPRSVPGQREMAF
jgi:hypothetical protein